MSSLESMDLNEMNLNELKARAKQLGIKGYSKKRKQEIIDLIRLGPPTQTRVASPRVASPRVVSPRARVVSPRTASPQSWIADSKANAIYKTIDTIRFNANALENIAKNNPSLVGLNTYLINLENDVKTLRTQINNLSL